MISRERASLEVEGIVQGVGFRPFIYRLAGRHDLAGWVRNTGRGVQIEVEGASDNLDAFCRAIREEAPPLSVITALSVQPLSPEGTCDFLIL
jgi:hydrogenase maturation protein HypF